MAKYQVSVINPQAHGLVEPWFRLVVADSQQEAVDNVQSTWEDVKYIPYQGMEASLVEEETVDTNTCLVLRYRNGTKNELRKLADFPVDAFGLDVADIVKVTASGEFLELIRAQFTGLPDSVLSEKSRIKYGFSAQDAISWYGDHAKFIVGNLQV